MRFNKTNLVKTEIGKWLLPLGFTLEPGTRNEFWIFSRKKNDVTQVIEIVGDENKYIELRYRTSLSIYPESVSYRWRKEGVETTEDFYIPTIHRGWRYDNKSDFEKILIYFKKLIQEYVLEELEKRSIFESEIRITTERYMFLKKNYTEIINDKETEWKIGELSLEQQMDFLSKKIALLKGFPFKNVDLQLEEIGIVYGNMMISQWNGIWEWNDYCNGVSVGAISKRLIRTKPVLAVFDEWQDKGTLHQDLERLKKEMQETELIPKHLLKYYFK